MADELTSGGGDTEYGLVMPFVVVVSKGGPFDDFSFVAGFECGQVAAELQHLAPKSYSRTVHTANVPQLDLIAMNEGYAMRSEPTGVEGWSNVTMTLGEEP